MGRPREDIENRFWKFVNKGKNNECWNWTGSLFKNTGYGQFSCMIKDQKKNLRSNRVSWVLHFGEIPKGMFVCHNCDNQSCVNPSHLFLGSPVDNAMDMIQKKRKANTKGMLNGGSKLTDHQVMEIREKYSLNDGSRSKYHKIKKYSQHRLAREYGVTQSIISEIVNRVNWKHI